MRLDIWLDVACLFRTRSEAQKACKGGKVGLQGQSARPNREVKPGDILDITRPHGRRQRIEVLGLAGQHIPKAEARALYRDITPPPTPEEQQMIDLLRLAGPRRRPAASDGAPDRRERRRLRDEKEGGGW